MDIKSVNKVDTVASLVLGTFFPLFPNILLFYLYVGIYNYHSQLCNVAKRVSSKPKKKEIILHPGLHKMLPKGPPVLKLFS